MGHNATAGLLKEKYITRFLRDMTPQDISLASGVLFDLSDRLSPQLDLIATLDEVLPSIIFHDNVSMIPVEAALWAIEIKSELKSCHLEQLSMQNRWIKETPTVLSGGPPVILPTAILALDGLSKEKVIQWLNSPDAANTVICCVIGKYHLIRQENTVREFEGAAGSFTETMHFISDYWGGLRHLREKRRATISAMLSDDRAYPHPLEAYLKGMYSAP